MGKFSRFVQEESEYLSQYKRDKEQEKKLSDRGYTKTREKKIGDNKKSRDYAGKAMKKGDASYHGYVKTTKDNQTGKNKGTESAFVKTTPIKNGIKRQRLHTRKHTSVNAAASHVDDLYKHHKEND